MHRSMCWTLSIYPCCLLLMMALVATPSWKLIVWSSLVCCCVVLVAGVFFVLFPFLSRVSMAAGFVSLVLVAVSAACSIGPKTVIVHRITAGPSQVIGMPFYNRCVYGRWISGMCCSVSQLFGSGCLSEVACTCLGRYFTSANSLGLNDTVAATVHPLSVTIAPVTITYRTGLQQHLSAHPPGLQQHAACNCVAVLKPVRNCMLVVCTLS